MSNNETAATVHGAPNFTAVQWDLIPPAALINIQIACVCCKTHAGHAPYGSQSERCHYCVLHHAFGPFLY